MDQTRVVAAIFGRLYADSLHGEELSCRTEALDLPEQSAEQLQLARQTEGITKNEQSWFKYSHSGFEKTQHLDAFSYRLFGLLHHGDVARNHWPRVDDVSVRSPTLYA